MKAMLIDDEKRPQVQMITNILESCHIEVQPNYIFAEKMNVNDFQDCVAQLQDPPDIAVIDYSLRWEDNAGTRWDGDRIAAWLRNRWRDTVSFYILFVSARLSGMTNKFDALVHLLRVPYTGYVEFTGDWEAAVEAHIRCACDLVRVHQAHNEKTLDPEAMRTFLGKEIIGRSPALLVAGHQARHLSLLGAKTVLICGETGTGKEPFARKIHAHSSRASGPFVPVNCGAIPETLFENELFGHVRGAFSGAISNKQGLFEQANDGTLFLDEVGELPLTQQVKLLRAVEYQEFQKVGDHKRTKVNVHIIAATNKDLGALVEKKLFRQDLYYRLSTPVVRLPPLRERGEDVLELADHFLKVNATEYSQKSKTLSTRARKLVRTYRWPGNVRQLMKAIEHVVMTSNNQVVEEAELRGAICAGPDEPVSSLEALFDRTWKEAQTEFKRSYFHNLVEACHGVIQHVADRAGLRREPTDGLLRKLEIHPRPRT